MEGGSDQAHSGPRRELFLNIFAKWCAPGRPSSHMFYSSRES